MAGPGPGVASALIYQAFSRGKFATPHFLESERSAWNSFQLEQICKLGVAFHGAPYEASRNQAHLIWTPNIAKYSGSHSKDTRKRTPNFIDTPAMWRSLIPAPGPRFQNMLGSPACLVELITPGASSAEVEVCSAT